MKVFELRTDWANRDSNDVDITLYSTHEKAKAAFLKEIETAKVDYDQAFDEDGVLCDGWVLDDGVDFWELYQDNYYCFNHCTITINEREVL